MENQEKITVMVPARAWVLQHGKDCDGGSSFSCHAYTSLVLANEMATESNEGSDGMYYAVTEKWSDVLEYCSDWDAEADDQAWADKYDLQEYRANKLCDLWEIAIEKEKTDEYKVALREYHLECNDDTILNVIEEASKRYNVSNIIKVLETALNLNK